MTDIAVPASPRPPTITAHGVLRTVLSNLPFVLLMVPDALPSFIAAVAAGTLLFFVPGLAWVDRRIGDPCTILFRTVVVSLLISVAVWVILLPLPGPTSRALFLAVLWAITNAGLLRTSRRGGFDGRPFRQSLFASLAVVALCLGLQSYIGAAYRVPPLEDHDSETQGTAYGLIHHFEPSMVTNRNSTYFFAHPLLLHFWIGESALLTGDLDRLKYYYDSAIANRGADKPALDAQWSLDFEQFQRDPVLLPTRTPNIFLGALVVFPLGFIVFALTGSRAAAVGAAVLYATLPEIYVRSSYGGYMAVANFLALSAAYFHLQATLSNGAGSAVDGVTRSPNRLAFGASVLGALADQKIILVSMATSGRAALRVLTSLRTRTSSLLGSVTGDPAVRGAMTIVIGFGTGWALYALYGSSISRWYFYQDHIVGHVVDRMRLQDVNLATSQTGAFVYPSIVSLWGEFAAHTGWLVAVPMFLATLWGLARVRRAEGVFALWALIGAIGFSLVDWRQTKHLAQIAPALAVLVGAWWAALPGRVQHALAATLAAGVAWNVVRILLLMNDFTFLQPHPIW